MVTSNSSSTSPATTLTALQQYVLRIERTGPLDVYYLRPGLPLSAKTEIMVELHASLPAGAFISCIGDEIAVSGSGVNQ